MDAGSRSDAGLRTDASSRTDVESRTDAGSRADAASHADAIDRRFTWAAPGFWAMLALHASALLAFHPAARPTAGVLALAVACFVVRTFAVSAGFHRYFAHRAFRTSRAMQFVLAFIGGTAVLRSALWWASQHRRHHTCADRPGDPHSPRDGLLWAHMAWFTARGNQDVRADLVADWMRFPELRWLARHEFVPVLAFIAFTFAAGGFAGWVWAANVGTVVLCHATFALNSVTHRWGRAPHAVDDHSRNLLLVALLTFGEGWHNNHHRFPQRARLGEGRAQIDIAWWGIRLLERLGLVWDVRR